MLRKRKHYTLRAVEYERNDTQRAMHDVHEFAHSSPERGDKAELVGWQTDKPDTIRTVLARAITEQGLNGRVSVSVYDLGKKKPRAWLTWLG